MYIWLFPLTAYDFITDELPRTLYLCILLRIPALYYSRVTRVFQDARLSMPDIQRMYSMSDSDVDIYHADWAPEAQPYLTYKQPASNPNLNPPPTLLRFRGSWNEFIDSMVAEWQVQNIISALLLSAVLTLLQIDGIGTDILCRTTAIISLVCSLMSILYCCVFIARFGTMKKLYKAASWAEVCLLHFFFVKIPAHGNTGSTKDRNCSIVERVGVFGYANDLALVVGHHNKLF
jgi:hypothetical protein